MTYLYREYSHTPICHVLCSLCVCVRVCVSSPTAGFRVTTQLFLLSHLPRSLCGLCGLSHLPLALLPPSPRHRSS